jgi:hypothetical protein
MLKLPLTAFDFDTDSCYNAPAVGPDGSINGGRDPGDAVDSPSQNCRDASYLDANNVYVRTRCNNGWCAHLYGYYMEVDAKSTCSGHRHDWEHVVVWTEGDAARYVAASAHGGYDVRAFDDVQQDNGHAKIVYHRDGSSTHAMRFAKDDGTDEPPENDAGVWFYGGLVSYYGFPSNEIRDAMMGNDWGSGKIDFSDARIADALEAAKGGNDIPLDVGVDESVPGDRVCE